MVAPAVYGTEITGGTFVPIGSENTAKTGDICQATYAIGGIGSYFTGIEDLVGYNWQPSVLSQIQQTMITQNCTLLYASIDPDNKTVFVQFTPNAAAAATVVSSHARAEVIPVIVYEIVLSIVANLIAAGIIAWFLLDVIPEATGKLINVASSSTVGGIVVYGGMALVGLIVVAYIMREWRGIHQGYDSG